MALRAVPEHPKFARLKMLLQQPKGPVAGWLEMVWHFAGRFTPHGNIGKYSDVEIESWVEWDGVPGALVKALTESEWLDPSLEHRLLVHDWHLHADNATKLSVKRSGKPFCSDSVSTVSPQCVHKVEDIETPLRLPVPEPVPEPVKKQETALVERTFDFYCVTFKRNKKVYSLTPDRRKKAMLRVRERLAVHEGDLAAVETDFKRVVLNLAASEFHRDKNYLDWNEQIFRSQEEFEKRLNWKRAEGTQQSKSGGPEPDTSAARFASFNAIRARNAEAEAQLGNQ